MREAAQDCSPERKGVAMVSQGPDMFGSFGLLAAAVLVAAALAGLTSRYGWRFLLAMAAAAVAGGLALALGLPVPEALAAAVAVAVLPTALLIRAARTRRAVVARQPTALAPVTAAAPAAFQSHVPTAAASLTVPTLAVPVAAPAAVGGQAMPASVGSPAALQAHAPAAAVSPVVATLAAPVTAPAAVRTQALPASAAGAAVVRARTGKGWVRAAGFGLFGVVFAAMIAGAILSNPSADAEGTRLVLGVAAAILVLFGGIALVFVQHARSGVIVDRAAGTVTVRRGRGLGMKRTVLPVSGVAAVEVADHERRVITPKHGLGAVIELVRYVAAPRRETVYEVFLAPSAGGQRVLVSPFAEKDVFTVLPLAEQLAVAIGCPLQVPFNPSLVPSGLAAASLAATGVAAPVAA